MIDPNIEVVFIPLISPNQTVFQYRSFPTQYSRIDLYLNQFAVVSKNFSKCGKYSYNLNTMCACSSNGILLSNPLISIGKDTPYLLLPQFNIALYL